MDDNFKIIWMHRQLDQVSKNTNVDEETIKQHIEVEKLRIFSAACSLPALILQL